MIPASQADWHRPPQFMRLGPRGDCRVFLWVAEPNAHEIYGVSFRVSESLIFTVMNEDRLFELLRKESLKELHRRIEAGQTVPEGFDFEAADWNPILVRDQDGTISIQRPTPPETEFTKAYVAQMDQAKLEMKNLYLRPGRLIPVNGPQVEPVRSEDVSKLEPGSGA